MGRGTEETYISALLEESKQWRGSAANGDGLQRGHGQELEAQIFTIQCLLYIFTMQWSCTHFQFYKVWFRVAK